jgi:hypothetical protein
MCTVTSLAPTQNQTFQRRFGLRSLRLKSQYNLLSLALMSQLTERRALENVLDKLNACKMDSARIGDRVLRFVKRGELASAVDKCSADITHSLEEFRVSAHDYTCT